VGLILDSIPFLVFYSAISHAGRNKPWILQQRMKFKLESLNNKTCTSSRFLRFTDIKIMTHNSGTGGKISKLLLWLKGLKGSLNFSSRKK
jgi:hypothetical protein